MTERYTQQWMNNKRIKWVLVCSQMDSLDPHQQEWLEQIVTIIQETRDYDYTSFGSKGRKALNSLAASMCDIQRVGKKTRQWVIFKNAEDIAKLETTTSQDL